MNRISLSTRTEGYREAARNKLEQSLRHQRSYAVPDFSALREKLESRMFVGPPKPVDSYKLPPSQESRNYWRMADEFSRYGYLEVRETGTPCIAEFMGY